MLALEQIMILREQSRFSTGASGKKICLLMQESQSLGQENPLEKEIATHSSILA